jgi:hypothetical protein
MAITQRQKTTYGGSVTGLSNAPLGGSIGIVDLPKTTSGQWRAAKR